MLFTANGFFQKILRTPGQELSLDRIALSGGGAGLCMAFVNCPIELLKVRLQVQDPSRPAIYRNIFDCAIKTVTSEGVFGLYRGITTTILRDIPSMACYFGAYEAAKRLLADPVSKENAPTDLLLAGGIAGICTTALTMTHLYSRMAAMLPSGRN